MEQPVTIKIDAVNLEGTLGLPEQAKGVVLFAHGSGSSRLSPRNTYVARVLQQAGIGTLLYSPVSRRTAAISSRKRPSPSSIRRMISPFPLPMPSASACRIWRCSQTPFSVT